MHAQVEPIEQATGVIGLYVNANKSFFEPKGTMSTSNCRPLKLLHRFTYNGVKRGVKIRIRKAWTAIVTLSIIWTSVLSDEIERTFFQAVAVSILLYGCTT